MKDTIRGVIEFIKLQPKYLLGLVIACIVLLFAPDAFLKYIGLYKFAHEYRMWISIVFLIAGSLLMAHILDDFYRTKVLVKRKIKEGRKYLHNLTNQEKTILGSYIYYKTKTMNFRLSDGVVQSLVNKYILYQASNTGAHNQYPFNIYDWAWNYLNEHPELVNIPMDELGI